MADAIRSGSLPGCRYNKVNAQGAGAAGPALFGGTGAYPSRNVKADPIPWDNKEYSVEFDVPPYSVTAFAFNWTQPEPAEKPASKKKAAGTSAGKKGAAKAAETRAAKKAEEEKKLAAILKAVKKSDKSYDEIMAFLES